jgi:hypothetical protein
MTTTRKFYALYNSYGIQTTGRGEQAHIFSGKKSRDMWVDACNRKAAERGAVTAKAITAKQAQKIIKTYVVISYEHENGKIYVKDNEGRIVDEVTENEYI